MVDDMPRKIVNRVKEWLAFKNEQNAYDDQADLCEAATANHLSFARFKFIYSPRMLTGLLTS